MPDRNIDPNSLRIAFHGAGYGLGIWSITMGVSTATMGVSRMATPGWQVALTMPVVEPPFWGMALACCGVAILVAIRLGARGRTAMATASFVASFIMMARCVAGFLALSDPQASWLGPQMWLAFAVAFMGYGILHLKFMEKH